MSSPASQTGDPSPQIRRTWRPLLLTDPRRRFRRYFRRAAVGLLALGLLAGLWYVLFPPLLHPHTHVVVLTGAEYQSPAVPTLEFAANDVAGFETLRPALVGADGELPPLVLPALARPEALATWDEACRRLPVGPSDALLVYAVAHGVCSDGQPQLLCGSYDPAEPAAGACSVRELLRPLAASGGAVKLLILDAGRLGADPLAGSVVNEFPRLLQREVLATGDPRLWVLSAAAPLQRSQVSTALQRSVFGYLVTAGLSGAADANADQTVDLAELHRFVSANADAWVREHSDGQIRQTPVLLNGAGRLAEREPPVLISTSALPKPDAKLSVSQLREINRSQPFVRIQPAVSPDSLIRPPTPLTQPSSLLPPSLSRHVSIAPAPVPTASSVGQAVAGAAGGSPPGEAAKESAAAGAQPAAKPPGNGEQPAEAGEATAESGPSGSPPPPPPQAPPLLVEAWQLRDALEDRRLPTARPVDFAPDLWREFQSQLLSYERQVRGGRPDADGAIAAALRKTILPLAEWLPGTPAAASREPRVAAGIALRIAQRRPPLGLAVQQPRSLGLAELAVGHDPAALPEALRKQAQQLDEQVERGQREAFDKWLAELPPELDQFVEFRMARRWGGLSGITWETIQQTLRVRRLAERLAARRADGAAWIAPAVQRGDRLLLVAERRLLDQIGANFESPARQALRQAEESYRAAEADAALVESATQFSNEVAARAFFYLEFCRQADLVRDGGGPAPADVKKLFGLVRRLGQLLCGQRPEDLPELKQTHEDAQWVRSAVELGLQDAHFKRLLQANPVAGDAQRIETLLSTPLPAAELRIRLLKAATDVDIELTSAFTPLRDPAAAVAPPELSREDWVPALQTADLACALASLAAPEEWSGGPSWQDLNAAYEKLLATPGPAGEVPDERLFSAHRDFGNALRNFFTALPERMAATLSSAGDLSQQASRRERLVTLRAALQAGRMAPGWDERTVVAAELQAKLRQADAYDLWIWQRQRALQAVSDAPAEDVAYLTDTAAHYRQQAAAVPGQPPPQPEIAPQLEIDAPATLTLTTSDQQEFAVHLRYAGSTPASAWVVLDYDPELLALRAADESVPLYRAESLAGPEPTAEPPSLVFSSGGQQTLRMIARRVGPSLRPTRLVIKATAGSRFVRQGVVIQLPAPAPIELIAGGIPNSWTATADGLLLHPFPNRATDFSLALLNRSGQPQSVDVQVRAVPARIDQPLPLAALSPDEADQLCRRLGATDVLATATELALPAAEASVPIAFPEPPDDAPAPAAKAPAGGEAAQPAPVAAPVVQELLVLITDRQTRQQTIRRIQVEPQRPRRFLQARVGYNLSRQRIEIRVSAPNPAVLPPGEIKVRAQFVEPLAEDAERRLDGELRAPNYTADLYAELESSPQRVATVRLDIDGYPRAFVFRVPCSSHSTELPEERDLLDVRITDLPSGRNYLPGDSVPVRLQVDAPPGAFDQPDDVVEIGVDVDRDRELEGEQVLALHADRQATIRASRFGPGGVMTLVAQVDDYLVTLPPVGLQNASANVIGRIIVGTRQRWSDAQPVVFDGQPPRATRIELNPDRALLHGAELTVLAWVTDDGLSGVAKVEAGLDIQRNGQLATEPKPAAAFQDTAGRWVAKVATGDYPPGQYTLLVRVTDNLNNSRLVKVRDIRLLTEQEAREEQKKVTNLVTGTVLFGSQAVPGALVELAAAEKKPEDGAAKQPPSDAAAEAEPPTAIAPLQMATDEQGRFSFPKVPPGDYRISARALLHNKMRQAVQDLSVPTPPKRLEPLRLGL